MFRNNYEVFLKMFLEGIPKWMSYSDSHDCNVLFEDDLLKCISETCHLFKEQYGIDIREELENKGVLK